MKKFLTVFILVFMLSVFCMMPSQTTLMTDYPNTAIADSGFDSDWGSDDWGSDDWGSDWDDDYDSGGGSSVYISGSAGIEITVVFIVIIFVFVITFYVNRGRKTARYDLVSKSDLPRKIGEDPELNQMAYDIYVQVQNAWMEKNLESVRSLLTDEMYNMYVMQLDTLKNNNQKNIMSDFEFLSGYTSFKKTSGGKETLKIVLEVSCKDYLVDEKTEKIIQGDKRDNLYIYELTFVRNHNASKNQHCPNCGAMLKNQMSGNCPYCGNTVTLTTDSYTLADKKMLKQRKL